MRWFKHMTDASDDEFVAAVESRFGLEGYARWWKLLEAVAKQTPLIPVEPLARAPLPIRAPRTV